ncbi:ATP-binding protein [Streptomyces sp. NPDC058045]|uniref:ATP-binding protein n=1 Tax=Streptomyces sp. NPDC058045 TaxID=3346311 RepID=UPI0036E5A485
MISQHSRHCTVGLQALPSRIGQIRRIVSAQLRYWHLDPLVDRAALGVTELLTNVHRHAHPDKTCTVEIELVLDRLTVSVHDHDPHLPRLNDARPYDTGGRGLALIAALSESWGAHQQGEHGKVVWFTLPAPTAAPVTAVPVYGAETTGPFTGTMATAARPGADPDRLAEPLPAPPALSG